MIEKRKAQLQIIDSEQVWTIPLTHGLFAIVDECDIDLAITDNWYSSKLSSLNGYAIANRNYKKVRMHRIILARKFNILMLDDNLRGDHINRNSLDNRRANLRLATHAENMRNSIKNTGKLKGAYYNKTKKRWFSAIKTKQRGRIHLGMFDNEQDAHDAFCKAARKYHGEFARTE